MATERPSESTPSAYNIKERPYAAFYEACRRGDIETVEQCCAEGIVLSQQEPKSSLTGLGLACLNGHLSLVKHFYDKLNVESNDDFYSFDSSIYSAFESGNIALVQYLCGKDDLKKSHIERGFQIACARGDVEIVRYLIEEQGIDPQKGDTIYEKYAPRKVNDEDYRRKILAIALSSGNLNFVRYFCEEKVFELSWLTPEQIFMEASRSGNLELIKYLHETKGIVFPLKNKKIFHAALKSQNLELIRYLHDTLDFEIDIPTEDKELYEFYSRPLNLELFRYLFTKLGNTEELRQFGNKVLLESLPYFNLSTLQYFCEERNHPIHDDLLLTCGKASIEIVTYLFEKHPDIRAVISRIGLNILKNALDHFNVEVIDYLCTIYNLKLEKVIDDEKNVLFYIAEKLYENSYLHDFELVKYLCEIQHLDVNAINSDDRQNTVLHCFAEAIWSHPDLLRYLWGKVKYPHRLNNKDETIAHACSRIGNPDQLPLFLSFGANLTATDSEGNNAILYLDGPDRDPDPGYFIKIYAYLYKHGVDVTQPNNQNRTGLDCLCDFFGELEYREQVEWLSKYPILWNRLVFTSLAKQYIDSQESFPLETSFACFMVAIFTLREENLSAESKNSAFNFLKASFEANHPLFLTLLEKCLLNEDERYHLNDEHTQFLLREILKGTLCDHNEDILEAVYHIYYDKAVGFRNNEEVHKKMLHISFLFIALLRKRSLQNIQDDSDSEKLVATPHDAIFTIVFSQLLKIDKVFSLNQLVTEYPAMVSAEIFDLCNYITGVNRSFVLAIFEDIERLCRINCVRMEIELRRLKTLQLQAKTNPPNEEQNNSTHVKREREEAESVAQQLQQFGLMKSGDVDGDSTSKKIKIDEAEPAQKNTEGANETVPRFA